MTMEGWTAPVVGVLGGLGPAATVTFLEELVRLTPAARDQDHIDAVVLQHSSTPDRTAAVLAGGPSPGPPLAADAQRLERLGVDLIVMPCNSAQAFVRDIEAATSLPLLSIVDLTAERAVAQAGETPIAVFATEGTMAAGTYTEAITARGGTPWVPPPEVQADLTAIIYDQVKAGRPVDLNQFDRAVETALAAGCSVVLLGCTELSVVYVRHALDARPELVDSLRCLVLGTLRAAGKEV